MTFLALEMAKITISGGQILTKNLYFWVIYELLGLRIPQKVVILRQIKMHKGFLENFKKTWKKSK